MAARTRDIANASENHQKGTDFSPQKKFANADFSAYTPLYRYRVGEGVAPENHLLRHFLD
jgi:hypothetical protein